MSVAEKKAAWIADYRMLVALGLTNLQIADRLNMSMDNFRSRVKRYDCRLLTRQQSKAVDLIRVWADRGERFTHFDFPEELDRNEVQSALVYARQQGLVVELGKKKFPWTKSAVTVFGVPGAPERVPTLFWDDMSWKDDGFSVRFPSSVDSSGVLFDFKV